MSALFYIVMALFIIVCVFLIMLVLIQKAAWAAIPRSAARPATC
jgi:preprotein translocase subunit SecG